MIMIFIKRQSRQTGKTIFGTRWYNWRGEVCGLERKVDRVGKKRRRYLKILFSENYTGSL
jgi:hypothetical protein